MPVGYKKSASGWKRSDVGSSAVVVKRQRTTKKSRGYASLYRTPKFNPRSAFPPTLETTLKYVDTKVLSYSAGTAATMWRANSIYDPDYTSTGGQPLYFDQLTAVYNHWRVKKSTCVIKIVDGPANTYNMGACLYLDDDTATATTLASCAMRPGASYKLFHTNEGEVTLACKYEYDVQLKGSLMANSQVQGSASADCVEQLYYVLLMQDPVLVRTGTGTLIMTTTTYTVVFDELKTVADS